MRSLAIGATGMLAQQTNVDVISNNIANMNTTAYTKRRAEFNDLLYQNIIRPGSASTSSDTIVPSGIQLGLGVRTAAVYRITDGTSLTNTNNTLDLAIRGRGYFQIELPEGKGTAYTRDGAFQRNGDGVIVTHDGYVVQPEITIPDDAVEIYVNNSGEVWIKQDGETDETNVGQLELATFQTRPDWKPWDRTCFWRPKLPARRLLTIRTPNLSVRFCRAIWKLRTSIRWPKLPSWSRRSALMR